MKKVGLVALAVLMTLLLSGCGKEQQLSCVQKAEGVDVTFNVGFKGSLVESMDFHYDLDLSEYSDTQIEAIGKTDFCETVKDSMQDYKDAFTDCTHGVTNKHLNVSAVLDVDKVAKNALDKMTTIEKAKTELEQQGYSCTIK